MLLKQSIPKDDFFREFLTMSQEEKYLDTTLLCSEGGSLQVSSLLLISMFPSIRDALRWRIRDEDRVIISLPDIPKHDIQALFDFVHNGTPTFKPSGFILQLLQHPVTQTRKVKEEQEEDKDRKVKDNETVANKSVEKKLKFSEHMYSGNEDVTDFCKTELDDIPSLDNDCDDWSDDESESLLQPKRSRIKKKSRVKQGKTDKPKEKRGRKKKEKDTNVNCPYCDYVAAQPRCLRPHIEVKHLNMRESFSCEICGKVYTSRSAVTLHMKSVHEKIRYSCDMDGCEYVCASGASVLGKIKAVVF